MQINCYHCNRPFALGKETIHTALDILTSQNLNHYNASCPHCRRLNRVSRKQLLRAAPDWGQETDEEKTADK
jgi:hypothetical protein